MSWKGEGERGWEKVGGKKCEGEKKAGESWEEQGKEAGGDLGSVAGWQWGTARKRKKLVSEKPGQTTTKSPWWTSQGDWRSAREFLWRRS